MSQSSVSFPIMAGPKTALKEITTELRSFIYLPKEGLQGEDIPSHLLWVNAKANRAKISFLPPLKCKEVFNAEKYEIRDNEVIIEKLEQEGYIGLSFESSKVRELEVVIPVEYIVHMSNGDVIKEERKIKLFKPQLVIKPPKNHEIEVNPKTGFIKGRINVTNIGRGTLAIKISTTEDSSTELVTPPEHREYAEKYNSDLLEELSELATEFPKFKSIFDETIEWNEKDLREVLSKERNELLEYLNKLTNVLAKDKELLQGFVEAYMKAAAKNSEYIEAIRRLVKLFESMVSRNIILANPLDELILQGRMEEVSLKISQTDKVFDEYDDIVLPKIQLKGSEAMRIPIYKLFIWG